MSPRPRPAPPSGQPPPRQVALADGTEVDLEAVATEVCARYAAEYPDEHERYGDAGRDWCMHDNQHLVNWAVLDTREYVSLEDQVSWLAKVLEPPPLLLIDNGRILRRNLRVEFISDDELRSKLREHGVDDPALVAKAYIEPDGEVTVIKK